MHVAVTAASIQMVSYRCPIYIISFYFIQDVCLGVSSEKLTTRLRSLSFKAMLRQEIGWFDQERNSTGALLARLADDASKVQGATGTHLAVLLETIVGLLMAVIVAFLYSWALALVILAGLPIVMLSSSWTVKMQTVQSVADRESLQKAGKVRRI